MKGLPQDQSFRSYISGIQENEQRIYLSVSEGGLSLSDLFGDDVTYPGGFHIFAESLRLKGKFSASRLTSKESTFTISTHDLAISSSDKQPPELSAPGRDGENSSAVRNSVTIDGKDAPTIAVYVENCNTNIAEQLNISAIGGSGGDNTSLPGTKGNEGDGGNGGDGGHIQIVTYTDLNAIAFAVYSFRSSFFEFAKLSGSQPDTYLPHNHPIIAAASLMHQQILQLPKGANSSGLISQSLSPLQTLIDSKQDTTFDGLANALFAISSSLDKYRNTIGRQLKQHSDSRGGAGGSAHTDVHGNRRGGAGKEGEDKSHLVEPVVLLHQADQDKIAMLRKQTRVFVHPEQCEMLYTRAMSFWYFGYRFEAMERLRRIVLRTAFLPLQSDDPLCKAYKDQETALHCPNSIERLNTIREKAIAQLSVLIANIADYYGRSPRWVPRLAFSEYKDAIRDAIVVHRRLEESHSQYVGAQKDKDAALRTIRGMKADAKKKIEVLNEELNGLKDAAVKSRNGVLTSTSPIEHAQTAFQNEFEAFAKKVQDTYQINFKEILEGAKSIYDNPKDKEAIAKTLYGVGKNYISNVINDDGEGVNKDELIAGLRKDAAAALKSLTLDSSFNEINGEYSTLAIVPDILEAEKKINETLAKFTTTPFASDAEDLKKVFKKFTDLLVQRNNDVAKYNATLLAIATALEKKHKAQELNVLADQKNEVDPDLDKMTSLVESIYEHSRAIVLRYFNEAQRALTFKTLEPAPDLLAVTDDDIDRRDMPLSITADVLQNMYNNLDSVFRKILEKKSNATSEFGQDPDHGEGKKCVLPLDILKKLKAEKIVTITIPPITLHEPAGPLNKDFRGDADVRVYHARFYLDGLKVPNGKEATLRTHITHAGAETIVSQNGQKHKFEHAQLRTKHSYRVREGMDGVEVDNGMLVHRPSDPKSDLTFALPGPFTTWTIDISNSDTALDLSAVTKGYLIFSGSSYTLDRSSG